MSILDSKTPDELHRSLLAEIAKATNELRCSQADVAKSQSRLQFALALLNELIKRKLIK